MRQRVAQLETLLRLFAPPGDGSTPVAADLEAAPGKALHIPIDISSMADINVNITSIGHVNADVVPDERGTSIGRFRLDDAEMSYVGSAHWAAVLDEVGIECNILSAIFRGSLPFHFY
jgi:hypothetical protein